MADRNDDSTRLSNDHLVDRFRAAVAENPAISVGEFFDQHPAVDRSRFLVPTIIADFQRREKLGKTLSPQIYFQELPELASHPDAWMILDTAVDWLVETEGADWASAWTEHYPKAARRFVVPGSNQNISTGAQNVDGLDIDDLQPGDRVLDFEIVRFVGRGTFARVYLANDLSLDRACALKVTVDQGSEGQVLARLSHPGIVHVYREQSLQGKKILAMQYIEGQSLAEWIQDTFQQHASSATDDHVREAARLVRDVATSLKHAHVRGVLHRDIKPANILLNQDGQPMLSDFNVATAADQCGRFTVGGTINYMSPEQLQAVCLNDASAERKVDIRSDVYSLGVVLLESITGQKTWSVAETSDDDAAAIQLLASRIRSGPPSIIGFAGVTPAFAAIIEKALTPTTDQRYQSAAELETDLTDWLEGRNNTYAANPSFVERTKRRVKRNQGWWVAAITASCLLACMIGWWYVTDSRQLDRCVQYIKQADAHIAEKRLTRASELLGQAKAQSQQLSLAKWVHPNRFSMVTTSLSRSSRQVSVLEASRFSSVFGEISLRRVHQNTTGDLASLIEDNLRSYKVMSARDWQTQPPFADLSASHKVQVAEGITELMLVSMYHSANKSRPSGEQIDRVLERLPKQHQQLGLFQAIDATHAIESKPFDETISYDPFEAYLYGVLATMEQTPESARNWYSFAIRNRTPYQSERFWWHYRQGYTCQELDLHDEAFIHYGICLGLQPDFAWPKFNMGLACLDSGNADLAETYIQQAIQVDPEFSAAYVALIAIQSQQGKYKAALATYDQATAHGVSSPKLTSNRDIAKSKLVTQAEP